MPGAVPNPRRVIFRREHRHPPRCFFCPRYDDCLTVADYLDWEGGFACDACKMTQPSSAAIYLALSRSEGEPVRWPGLPRALVLVTRSEAELIAEIGDDR